MLAEATFTVADVVTTLALPRSAFTVSLFAKQEIALTRVVRIADATSAGDPAPGYAVETTGETVDGCPSSPAARDPGIVACFPHAASADICWVRPDRVTLLCGGNAWEKKLYQYQSDQPVGTIPRARPVWRGWVEHMHGFRSWGWHEPTRGPHDRCPAR